METKQISLKQFMALFFLSRITLELLHTVNDTNPTIGSERAFGILLMLPMMFIFSLPIFWLINYNGNYGAAELAKNTNNIFGIVVTCIYILFFLYNIMFTLCRTEMFLSINKISESNAPLILIGILTAACFCVTLGVSALGRAATTFRIFVVIALILTYIVLFGTMNLLNLYESPGVTGFDILGAAWRESIKTNEITLFIVLLSKINLPKRVDVEKNIISDKVMLHEVVRSIYSVLFITILVILVLFLGTRLILGDSSEKHSFTNFIVGGLMEVTAFKRLTIVQSIVYILLIHMRITLYLYAVNYLLKLIIPKKAVKVLFPFICLGLFIITLVLANNSVVTNALYDIKVMSVLFILINLILPVSIILASKLKRSLHEKKIKKPI